MSSGLSLHFLDEEIKDKRCKGAYLKCIVWPLLVLSCLVVTIVTTTLTEDNLPDCLMRVCEHARACLDMFLTSDTTTLFSREEQGFLFNCGQCGGVLWKWTCETFSGGQMLPYQSPNLEA